MCSAYWGIARLGARLHLRVLAALQSESSLYRFSVPWILALYRSALANAAAADANSASGAGSTGATVSAERNTMGVLGGGASISSSGRKVSSVNTGDTISGGSGHGGAMGKRKSMSMQVSLSGAMLSARDSLAARASLVSSRAPVYGSLSRHEPFHFIPPIATTRRIFINTGVPSQQCKASEP